MSEEKSEDVKELFKNPLTENEKAIADYAAKVMGKAAKGIQHASDKSDVLYWMGYLENQCFELLKAAKLIRETEKGVWEKIK